MESRMSKVTQVYYGFVIPKNKCVKKKSWPALHDVGKDVTEVDSISI
jgi:hypothetical protein